MIKKLVFVIISVLMFMSLASAVPFLTFEWDTNTVPDLAGYRIYFSENSGDHVFGGISSPNFLAEIPCPPNDISCCTYAALPMSGSGYYYVATAYDIYGFESLPSNEINSFPPGKVKNFKLHK